MFTEFEIAILRNRLACDALSTLPYDAQWWNAFPDDKSKLYANLPVKELAQEAWDLMMLSLDRVAHLYFRAPFVEDYLPKMCLVMSTPYAPDSSKKVDLRKIKAEMEEIALKEKSSVPDASYDEVLKPVLLYDEADELENDEGSNEGEESPDEAEELEDEEGSDDYGDLCIDDDGGEEAYGFEDMSESEDEIKDEEMSDVEK